MTTARGSVDDDVDDGDGGTAGTQGWCRGFIAVGIAVWYAGACASEGRDYAAPFFGIEVASAVRDLSGVEQHIHNHSEGLFIYACKGLLVSGEGGVCWPCCGGGRDAGVDRLYRSTANRSNCSTAASRVDLASSFVLVEAGSSA